MFNKETMMRTPTIQQFKAWAKRNHSIAMAVVQARAFSQCERARVDAYIQPVFDLFDFYVKEEWRKGQPCKGVSADWRILEPSHLYLSDQEELCKEFYAECDKEHRKHGFTGPECHCPALIAENLVIKAEAAMIESVSAFLGQDFGHVYGEDRTKLLDLCLGACLKKAA